MFKEHSRDLEELKNSLSDTAFELSGFKYALDEAAIVAITDIKGTITYVNTKFCEISKYSQEELVGQNHRIINSGYHSKEFFKEMYRTIGQGNVWKGQIKNRAKDGSYYWVDTTIVPLKNREGKPIKYIAIRFDMTAQKNIEEELKRTLEDLEHTNVELEQFAYVASHDLREPLRMITSYAQLINKRYSSQLDENADIFIQYIVDGTSRMQQLIESLLLYSRTTAKNKTLEKVNLNDILDDVLTDLKIAIEDTGARIDSTPLPEIRVNPVQIRQLFQNLINNAIKFHGENPPEIHIRAEQKENEWLFSIKDNGIGIDPNYYERIFLIFQRLHAREDYPGTGIGLAICRKIVEQHKGRIWVESEEGKGSTFYFTLNSNL